MRKTNSSFQSIILKIVFIITCAVLVLIYNNSKAGVLRSYTKTHISFRQMVNLDISMKVKTSVATLVQVYLFTADGKLIKKIEASPTAEYVIKNPGSGIYLYQCFVNDKPLKSGKLILENNKLNYD